MTTCILLGVVHFECRMPNVKQACSEVTTFVALAAEDEKRVAHSTPYLCASRPKQRVAQNCLSHTECLVHGKVIEILIGT